MRRGPSSDRAPYERLAPVADAFGAPGLRDQDRIGGPGTAGRSQPGVATHRRNSLGWGRRTDVWRHVNDEQQG